MFLMILGRLILIFISLKRDNIVNCSGNEGNLASWDITSNKTQSQTIYVLMNKKSFLLFQQETLKNEKIQRRKTTIKNYQENYKAKVREGLLKIIINFD